MNKFEMNSSASRSRGVALIFAVLLLLVLTVIAVGTLSTVSMQERMASNANLQTLAFEAASAGVAESVDFWLDDENSNWPAGAICRRGIDRDWATEWSAAQRLEVEGLPPGFVVQYQTRLGCFEAGDWVLLDDDGDPDTQDVPPPVQVLALSQGLVFRSNDGETATGDPIATRQIEVRLERRGGEPPDFCALNFCPMAPPPSGGDGTGRFDNRTLEMPNAQAFSIDGGAAGCAASFPGPGANRAEGQLSETQLQRYQPTPGIVEKPLEEPLKGILSDPEALARAVNAVKIGIRAWDVWESRYPDASFDNPLDGPDPAQALDPDRDDYSNPFESCKGAIQAGNLTNCPTNINGFHYIAGDVYMGPCTFRNFMIVEGDFLINGNPIYTEPLLVLGGTMETRGWGNSENSNIAIVQNLLSPAPLNSDEPSYGNAPDPAETGECSFRVAGGGTGALNITDVCDDLQKPWEDLNSCLDDLDDMSKENTVTWDGNAETGSLLDYIQAITNHEHESELDLNFKEVNLAPEIRFSVPQCSGDPLAADRRNVIASWREFIDRGRWENVGTWDEVGP